MLSRDLRKNGVKSEFLAFGTDCYLNIGYDYAVPNNIPCEERKRLLKSYFWKVLMKYDVIHSHCNCLFSYDGSELEFLKKCGKVVVFHFRGCDIRNRTENLLKNPDLNCCSECDYPVGSCSTEHHKNITNKIRSIGDAFFVTTPDLNDFVPTAEYIPLIMTTINIDDIEAVERDKSRFRVVTSSNHHGIDGTKYIRRAVSRLREEGHRVDYIEVEKTPYFEVLAIYKSADVFIGKLRMGYYNNANIETMMMGIPNMSYIRPNLKKHCPDVPIIQTTPETIYDNLLKYMNNRALLKSIGAKGPQFVKKYHEPNKVTKHLIKRYDELFRKKHSKATIL